MTDVAELSAAGGIRKLEADDKGPPKLRNKGLTHSSPNYLGICDEA